jgi:hypothetical protein
MGRAGLPSHCKLPLPLPFSGFWVPCAAAAHLGQLCGIRKKKVVRRASASTRPSPSPGAPPDRACPCPFNWLAAAAMRVDDLLSFGIYREPRKIKLNRTERSPRPHDHVPAKGHACLCLAARSLSHARRSHRHWPAMRGAPCSFDS